MILTILLLLITAISILIVIILGVVIFLASPRFGRVPQGEILARIQASPNYRDGRFHNLSPSTIPIFGETSFSERIRGHLQMLKRGKQISISSMKTNLKELNRNENVMVWMGHSSLFIQIDGLRFLIDPVLVAGFSVPFFYRPFLGSEVYTPDDIPDIDYLLITHDHWDHLDHKAVTRLRDRTGKVICGLGVGEHFRRWKFNPENIIELDWNESVALKDIILHIFPAQHISGRRSFGIDKTLWVSFMIEAPSLKIYISGDTGYGVHFSEIGKQFPTIDLAIIEFGYAEYAWRGIHIMPDNLAKAINDLKPKRSFTYHHAKYTQAGHRWKEPLEIVAKLIEQEDLAIITPMIGELVFLNNLTQGFCKWWDDNDVDGLKSLNPEVSQPYP